MKIAYLRVAVGALIVASMPLGHLTAQAAAPAAAPAAPAPTPPPPQTIKQLKPGLFMVTGGGGNSTVRVTSAGIILIDGKNPGQAFYDGLLAQIGTVTPTAQPIKIVFNTHHHGDHSGNNERFIQAGAQVVASENLKTIITTYTPNPGQQRPAPPNVTFARDYQATLGGVQVRAHHEGPGHTGGDSIIYLPDVKTVAFGDELVAATPNCDYPNGGSLAGWIKSLDAALKLDFDTAIPGHGDNPMTKAQVAEFKTKLETLVSRGKALVKAGTPKDQLIAQLKVDDLGWNLNVPNWTQPARLDPFYAELSK
jgi:cyclase